MEPETVRGVKIFRGLLDRASQEALVDDVRAVCRVAPLFSPMTPYGKPMRVRLTSAGDYGWVSDAKGYRYATSHPSGMRWPPIPPAMIALWRDVVPEARLPECCLVNYYGEGVKMGLHQDRDEADFSQPVLSVSLGDQARFRLGNSTRGGSTESTWLASGDVAVMGGEARMLYHGIDQIRFGSSDLLPAGGRINLTLRVVS